jgi:trigger factor
VIFELDDQGNEKEEGIGPKDVLLSVELIKDEEIKNQFIGKKKEEIAFNPVTAYNDRHEVGHLLKISHEQAHDLNSNFNFTVNEIHMFLKRLNLTKNCLKNLW